MKHGTVAIDRHEPNCHQPAAATPSQLTIARGCAPCSTGPSMSPGTARLRSKPLRVVRAAEVYLAHETEQRRSGVVRAFSASVEVLVRAGLDTAETLSEPLKHNHNGGKGQS